MKSGGAIAPLAPPVPPPLQDSAKVGYSNRLHIVGGAHDVRAREHYKVGRLYGFRNPRAPLKHLLVSNLTECQINTIHMWENFGGVKFG